MSGAARSILGTAAALAVFLGMLPAARAQAPIPVFLDTDIGDDIDDALALALALRSPELKILGVSTVLQDGAGRADLVWHILNLYGRPDIPVGSGAEQPLIAPPRTGLVRQTEVLRPGDRMPPGRRRNGVELMIETCLRSPEKVTLVAYGPLTNVAIALRAEPALRDHIERVVLMNGVFFHAGLEYNTKMDPEASEIVYNSGLPVTTVGLDVTLKCELPAGQLNRIREATSPAVQFLWKLIQIWQEGDPNRRPILHDPLSIIATVRPGLLTLLSGSVQVETKGTADETYGMTVFRAKEGGLVRVARDVDAGGAIDLFLSRILSAGR